MGVRRTGVLGSRVWIGVAALALAAIAGAAGACAAPSIEGDDFDIAPPRPRAPDPTRTTDGTVPPPTRPTTPSPTDSTDGGADATADADAGPAPGVVLCSAPDLVLCFPFEGSVVDKSTKAINPAQVSNVSFIAGKDGLAGSFDKTSVVHFAPNAAFDTKLATIEAWVKLAPGATGDGVIFDADGRFSLTIEPDADVKCKSSTTAVVVGKVAVDSWSHAACVFDGAKVRVYIDGVERENAAGTIGSSPGSAAAIGGNSPSGEPFVGAIDSLRVFEVARTAAEIATAAGK